MGELHKPDFRTALAAVPEHSPGTVSGLEAAATQSLEFALMAATRHAECGEWQAFVTAICDVVAIQHAGGHEHVSDGRMATHLRNIAGLSYVPPTPDEAA